MAVYDAIIVGAGAAGLAAAKTLSDAGRTALILEARNRIGGRIHTVRDPSTQTPVELGAEFIHGAPGPTMDAVRDTRLTAYEVALEHRVFRRGRLVRSVDFPEHLSRVMGGLTHLRGPDISFAEYLRRHARGRSLAEPRRLAAAFVEGFDAADAERISARSLAREQEDLGDIDESPQYRLVEGYGALCDRLMAGLDAPRMNLRLGTRASSICWATRGRGRGIQCRTSRGEALRARTAIVTLPIGTLHLPPGVPGAVSFEPEIPAHRRAAAALASGPVVKVVLSFREPFWEDLTRGGERLRDLSLMHDPDATFPTWWTQRPLRLPMLTAWAGGPKARALTDLKRPALVATALDGLCRLLDLRPKRLRGLLEGSHAADWGADPLALGAYSYETVGASGARAALARPIGGVLHLAGEAADTSGQASTVAGALASGTRAARAVLRGS